MENAGLTIPNVQKNMYLWCGVFFFFLKEVQFSFYGSSVNQDVGCWGSSANLSEVGVWVRAFAAFLLSLNKVCRAFSPGTLTGLQAGQIR